MTAHGRSARFWLVSLAAFAALLLLAVPALANEAAVVVRHGDGSVTYALVVFSEEDLSSFDLLDRSTLSLTTVAFGGLGEAVCTLDGEGCPVADCQQRLCQSGDPDSPFWQFFRPGTDGAWVSQPLGASTSRVSDGDVDLWSWTGGDANLPPITIDDVASRLGVSTDAAEPGTVHVASFDAAGNRIEPENDDGPGVIEAAIGAGALVLLAGGAIVLARRRAVPATAQR
jgi:hypothetical protein